MAFLRHFRSRSKLKAEDHYERLPRYTGHDFMSQLPSALLESIFAFVCPHSQDNTYETSETSAVSDGCMLCDLRDLSSCAQVSRRWKHSAESLLYHSVRIDAVHYCELEEVLAESRKRKPDRKGNSTDIPALRLRLFEQTVRANRFLAAKVMLLKLPYMTRETCKVDLARIVSVLSNLHYVDLPEGFFSGDATSHTLRQELLTNCPEIRKMRYIRGSEQAFESLAHNRQWMSLEVLELSQLAVEPTALRYVLACLPILREVKMARLPWLDNTIFRPSTGVPDFPPVQKLELEETHGITSDGLLSYLSRPEVREVLSYLSLHHTGVNVPSLAEILWKAPYLQHFSITESVSRSLPLEPLRPLRSISLQTLHFEITSNDDTVPPGGRHTPADSYYTYLSTSLHANGLPALRKLYVRDSDFAENLTLLPPAPGFVNGRSSPNSQSYFSGAAGGPGLQQKLEVYTKGLDELDWVFTSVTPPDHARHRRGSSSSPQPVSAFQASKGLGPQWGGEARKSIMVGNGLGGFLAVPVPAEEPAQRPLSSASWRKSSYDRSRSKERKSRGDLWR